MPSERDFYNISLKLFLKNNKGEVLVLKAREDGLLKGFHDLPGGRMEKDEFKNSFSEIIGREVIEEIGKVEYNFNPRPMALARVEYPKRESPLGGPVHWLFIFFEANYKGGDITISDEHLGFEWVKLTKENLQDYFWTFILEGAKMYLENYGK